jgi:hypothetical protein
MDNRGIQNKDLLPLHTVRLFLMGCIQSGSPLNMVRLTYKNGLQHLENFRKEKNSLLMRHPLLRSGVLNGLL